ncbi:hypothetical protein EST38_g9237 [Candolleomyces aberdarensis]|uniref:RING-type domain-containing protein n=1 Tax=Candolleomyces aberdarensis TaxID=2316362 RepID=A0A4Q2DCS2_9AGAR|nr:hypothetical protein EST38_g9237 [Candolleomyces aberdarensis]
MLAAGPGSCCDVCIEPFGTDGKTPCSITCGHVFCMDCLDRITRSSCPICRGYFDPKAVVKLHLDLDSVQASPKGNNAKISPEDLDAAQDLHQRVSNIAEQGSSETQVRALISDVKKFLQDKPRSSFKDLRTLHRMVSYLCEVKTDLRARKQAVDGLQKEKVALLEEKAELKKKIEEHLAEQKKETQRAVKVEVELRDHCTKAHEAYTRMVDQYNYVAKEWMKLNDEVKRLRLLTTSEGVTRASPSSEYHLPALELDQDKLDGVAVRSENSIILAPLPQYTNRPDTTMSLFMPLPEEDEDEEEEDEDEESSEESDPEPSEKHVPSLTMKYGASKVDPSEVSCGAIAHPYSCDCKGVSVFEHSSKHPAIQPAQPVRPSVAKPLKPAIVNVDRPLHSAPKFESHPVVKPKCLEIPFASGTLSTSSDVPRCLHIASGK